MSTDKSVKEINAVIAEIEKALAPKCEIGSRDKATLTALLKADKSVKKVKFFSCQRDQSAKILSFFVKEKSIPLNKFSTNQQPFIYIVFK